MKSVSSLLYLRFCLPLLFGLISFNAFSNADAKEVFELRYGSALGPNHTFSRADKDWMQYIEEKSDGRIKIKPFWSATLISSDNNVAELRHGVTDIAMITPIYARAGMQAIRTQTGFYIGGDKIETQIEVFHCLLRDFPVFKQELDGVKVLVAQGGTSSYILTKDKPITTLEEIAGLRLRSPTALVPVVYELGADPILLPMGDVYPAFAKGIIDGVLTPEDTLRSLHFAEIGRYLNRLAMHRGAYPSQAVSEKTWQQLPNDLQNILLDSGRYWESRLTHYILDGNAAAITYGQEQGVEFIDVEQSAQQRFNKIYADIARSDAQKLSRYGIDGEAIFDYVLDTIHNINQGQHLSCR